MWKTITKEEYMSRVGDMKPMESFSDPTGESPLGRGYPLMETIWGKDNKHMLKAITSKENPDQTYWENQYFENDQSI